MLNPDKFGDILFNSLPRIYISEDNKNKHALKRYLKAISEGGFSNVINENKGLLDLHDSDKVSFNILEITFEQYGFPVFYGIPEMYLRKLLPIVGDLYATKGSISSIEYITGIISDVKSTIVLDEDFYENFKIYLTLDMTSEKRNMNDFPTQEQLLKIIENFIPFFFSVYVDILDNFNEFLAFSFEEESLDELLTTKNQKLESVLNIPNKLINRNSYLNEEKEAFFNLAYGDYAKDEIYINGELHETVEY